MSGCKDCLEYSSTLHNTLPQLGKPDPAQQQLAHHQMYMPYAKTLQHSASADMSSHPHHPPPPGCNMHNYVSYYLQIKWSTVISLVCGLAMKPNNKYEIEIIQE